MQFTITIKGTTQHTDPALAERNLRVFMNMIRQVATFESLNLVLPMEVVLPEKKDPDSTSTTCQIRGLTVLEAAIAEADILTRQAHEAGDDDAYIEHFTRWLSLYSQKHDLPWPGEAPEGAQ